MPWLWAGYKMGTFSEIDLFPEGLTQKEFSNAIEKFIATGHLTPITYYDDRRKPVGIGFFWVRGRVWQTCDLLWFPWASSRNVLESYVNFVNIVKETKHTDGKKLIILEFAREKDRDFFEHVCKYGVMSRVGSLVGIYDDGKAILFQSRSRK